MDRLANNGDEVRSWTMKSIGCEQRLPLFFPENEERKNMYLSSSSCSCSTSTLSTFKDDYSLTETETEMKQIQRSERKKPKFCAQKKKIIYMDKRHVRWNIKN